MRDDFNAMKAQWDNEKNAIEQGAAAAREDRGHRTARSKRAQSRATIWTRRQS